MPQITPQDMVNWFRARSKEFAKYADSLEGTFNLATGAPAVGKESGKERLRRMIAEEAALDANQQPSFTLTAAVVREKMGGKAMRLGALAGACGVTEQAVQDIIESQDSGLVLATRGWVKLSSP
jgi:hypothetical protein